MSLFRISRSFVYLLYFSIIKVPICPS